MVDETALEQIYQENLEENIISHLAKVKNISLDEAMDFYYNNPLSTKIHNGNYGIQYLDYKALVEIMLQLRA